MDGLVDIPDYLQRSVALLSKDAWIFRESNTKCVEMEVLDNIPEAWTEALSKLNNDEFNQMPCAAATAATVPKDLEELLSTAHQLKLEFNGEDQRAVHSTTEKLIKGMSPKKSHEIIRLAEFIHANCRSADVLVDLGCGLVREIHFLKSTIPSYHPALHFRDTSANTCTTSLGFKSWLWSVTGNAWTELKRDKESSIQHQGTMSSITPTLSQKTQWTGLRSELA